MPKFELELHHEAGSDDDRKSLRISGCLRDQQGTRADFEGWLELLTLLEHSLLSSASGDTRLVAVRSEPQGDIHE